LFSGTAWRPIFVDQLEAAFEQLQPKLSPLARSLGDGGLAVVLAQRARRGVGGQIGRIDTDSVGRMSRIDGSASYIDCGAEAAPIIGPFMSVFQNSSSASP
jgi:hypothetical protein